MDESFIDLAQPAVLASNRSDDKNNILELNSHSIDIFFCIENLEETGYEFDVDNLFNQAVNPFNR